MANYISLLEMDFRTGTQYFSFEGESTPTHWYKDRIVALGQISRQIPPQATSISFSTAHVTMSNAEGDFTALRAVETFRGVTVRWLFGDADLGLAAMSTLFTATISEDWTLTDTDFSFSVIDSSFDRLKILLANNTVVKSVNSTVFPNIPQTTPQGQLVPIPYGQNYTGPEGHGRSPAYLIDTAGPTGGKPYRYVIAQCAIKSVYQVYNYETLVNSSHYAVSTATYGGVTMTVIDFDADQRNSNRATENEISILLQGKTDGGGNLITNCVSVFEDFLLTFCNVSSGDLNAALWTAAANIAIGAFGSPGLPCAFTIIDPATTPLTIIGQFNANFTIWFFTDAFGKFGVYMFSTYTSIFEGNPVFTDGNEILGGSLSVAPTKTVYTRFSFNQQFNANKNRFEAFPDSAQMNYTIDSLAELTQGQIPIAWGMPWVMSGAIDGLNQLAPWDSRLQVLSETQDYVTFDLAIDAFAGLDLCSQLAITAQRGVGRRGFNKRGAVIVGLTITPQPSQAKITVLAMLFAPLYAFDPAKYANNLSLPSPWTIAVDGGGNSAIHIASGLLEMQHNTSGVRAFWPTPGFLTNIESTLIYAGGSGTGLGGPAVRIGGSDGSPTGYWVAYDLANQQLKLYDDNTVLLTIPYVLNVGDEVRVSIRTNNLLNAHAIIEGLINGVRVLGPLRIAYTGMPARTVGAISQCGIGGTLQWSYAYFGMCQYARAVYLSFAQNLAAIYAYWRMDDPSGTTATDVKATSNGTYVGGPTLGTAGLIAEDTDTAVAFNGTSQEMNAALAVPVAGGSGDFSIALWFVSGGNSAGAMILGHSGSDPQFGGADAALSFYIGATTPCNFGAVIPGQKYHVVATFDHLTGLNKLYKNGVLVDSIVNASTTGFGTLHFASLNGASGWWKGTLDEIMIYKNVLTPASVLSLYNNGR